MLLHRTPLTLLTLLVVPLTALTAHGDEKRAFVEDSFLSGGKKIRVERFEPAMKGKYPAVILLYGLDGIFADNVEVYRHAARSQADRGFVMLIVHYFDRTDTRPEEAPAITKSFRSFLMKKKGCEKQGELSKDFAAWKEVVKDSLAYVRKQENVDGKRIALVGVSLGGFLAAGVSSEPDQRVAAVVILFGGIPQESAKTLRHFPPALILSGDRDSVVPHQYSLDLRDLVRVKKLSQAEAHIYKGVDHGFKDGYLAALNAQVRVTDFLQNNLGQPSKK